MRLRLSQPSSSGRCDAVLGITRMTLISAESTASLLSGTAGIFKMRKSLKSHGTLKKRWKNLSPATGWGLKAYPISRQLSLGDAVDLQLLVENHSPNVSSGRRCDADRSAEICVSSEDSRELFTRDRDL